MSRDRTFQIFLCPEGLTREHCSNCGATPVEILAAENIPGGGIIFLCHSCAVELEVITEDEEVAHDAAVSD